MVIRRGTAARFGLRKQHRPGRLLPPTELTDEQVEQLRERWAAVSANLPNAHLVVQL